MSSNPKEDIQILGNINRDDHFYNILTSHVSSHVGKVFEFDVLPKDFVLPSEQSSPILVDDNNIAILKHVFVSVAVYAIKLFSSLVTRNSSGKDNFLSGQWIEAFEASTIILLFDPEHLTAVNFRKRFILSLHKEDDLGLATTFPQSEYVANELAFLESLQTSHLPRHTKSPTLWSHRKWLKKQQVLAISTGSRKSEKVMHSDILVELPIIQKSGERHPKNYYAWTYARWLAKQSNQFERVEAFDGVSKPGQELIARTCDWCLKNPTDTSGWSFLLFVLRDRPDAKNIQTVEIILTYALDFRWLSEAVWVFIRTIIGCPNYLPLSSRLEFTEQLNKLADIEADSTSIEQDGSYMTRANAASHLDKALSWINENGSLS